MTHADLENFKKDTFELGKSSQIFEEDIKALEAELRLWDMKMKDLVDAARLHLDGIAQSGVLGQVNQKMIAEEVLAFENPNPGALHHLDQLERILDREFLKLQDQINDNQNRKLAAEVVARNLEIERAGLDRRIEELETAISREKEEVSLLLDKESGVIRDLSVLGNDLETQKRQIALGIDKGTREVAELEQERAKARAQLEGYLDDLTSAKRGFEAAKRELFDIVLAAKERLMAVLKLRVQLDVEVNHKTQQFCQDFIQEAFESQGKQD
jgi:chromosome segregation ATPase